jgi:Carboxypeptidase regulatory-like domain
MISSRGIGVALAATCLFPAAPSAAQTVRGRVLDASNGRPVQMAGVYLLDRDRTPVLMTIADTLGRYALTVRDSADYILFTQRLGYVEVESPLLSMSGRRDYDLDVELRPEPIALDPLTVSVHNDTFTRWWTFQFGANPNDPNQYPGFRLIQGARLEEAKMRASDNTGTLRFLYIAVTHGRDVCIAMTPRARRDGYHRPPDEKAGAKPESCGRLYLNEVWIPNEHIESVDMRAVGAIATFPGEVHMFTRDFDWSHRIR